jgi:predicted protein tyrosine phosphatase
MSDPTAIPLHLDPLQRRLTGWTNHGGHQIDVPLITQMYDAANDPVSRDEILGLAHWVNCALQDAPTLVHCQAGLNRSNLEAATALLRAVPAVFPALETKEADGVR